MYSISDNNHYERKYVISNNKNQRIEPGKDYVENNSQKDLLLVPVFFYRPKTFNPESQETLKEIQSQNIPQTIKSGSLVKIDSDQLPAHIFTIPEQNDESYDITETSYTDTFAFIWCLGYADDKDFKRILRESNEMNEVINKLLKYGAR